MVPQPVQALLLLYPITPGVQQSMATGDNGKHCLVARTAFDTISCLTSCRGEESAGNRGGGAARRLFYEADHWCCAAVCISHILQLLRRNNSCMLLQVTRVGLSPCCMQWEMCKSRLASVRYNFRSIDRHHGLRASETCCCRGRLLLRPLFQSNGGNEPGREGRLSGEAALGGGLH